MHSLNPTQMLVFSFPNKFFLNFLTGFSVYSVLVEYEYCSDLSELETLSLSSKSFIIRRIVQFSFILFSDKVLFSSSFLPSKRKKQILFL
jgi:hypothetical protein